MIEDWLVYFRYFRFVFFYASGLREERMMSKPEKVVVTLTKKQANAANKAKEVVIARRSGRRKE